jgi:hypothetical protein
MRFRSFVVFFLILGFLISLYGRVEVESISHSYRSESGISDHKDADNTAPAGENHPLGAHKDQHGCYHSHASLNLPVTVSLPFPIYCSNNVTETIPPFFLTIVFSITHPPRA